MDWDGGNPTPLTFHNSSSHATFYWPECTSVVAGDLSFEPGQSVDQLVGYLQCKKSSGTLVHRIIKYDFDTNL